MYPRCWHTQGVEAHDPILNPIGSKKINVALKSQIMIDSIGLTMIETLTLVGYAAQRSHFDRVSIFEDSYLPYLYLGMRS